MKKENLTKPNIKVTYQPAENIKDEEAERRINRAFDIVFNAVFEYRTQNKKI